MLRWYDEVYLNMAFSDDELFSASLKATLVCLYSAQSLRVIGERNDKTTLVMHNVLPLMMLYLMPSVSACGVAYILVHLCF